MWNMQKIYNLEIIYSKIVHHNVSTDNQIWHAKLGFAENVWIFFIKKYIKMT